MFLLCGNTNHANAEEESEHHCSCREDNRDIAQESVKVISNLVKGPQFEKKCKKTNLLNKNVNIPC